MPLMHAEVFYLVHTIKSHYVSYIVYGYIPYRMCEGRRPCRPLWMSVFIAAT
jgi:hypothetical protein